MACLRPFFFLCLAAVLAACSSTPSSTLGELPRTPQATTQQLLSKADQSDPELAAQLRLAAADQSLRQGNAAQARSILEQVQLETLKPALQIFALTLQAELALAASEPQKAEQAFQHPAFERLAELPVEQQVRSQLARAQALEANGKPIAAARERVFTAPLLSGKQAQANHETIWKLVSALPETQLQSAASTDTDLAGWQTLALSLKRAGTVAQQQRAIDDWVAQNPQHPAARQLPEPLQKLRELADQPLTHVALLLPMDGQLASVARALRDGFLAAHLHAQQAGQELRIELYDSTRISSVDDFYRQAQAAGVQLVVGPLEKDLVRQLAERDQLPITTLALNYSDAGQQTPPQLFQFGLAAEDEAREVARRAWADGHRRAIALAPRGEWGNRILEAFRHSWQEAGGTLVAAEPLAEPVQLANQIADLLQLRNSEERARRVEGTLDASAASRPTRRQDVDFIFLAATPQQAQQVRPTLIFQYAGDLPIYATSHLHSASQNRTQYLDLEGIRFAETPWLLDEQLPLRQEVEQKWPQAGGSLGRLYAMGADAYLLAPRLNQLLALPDTQLDGLSGMLQLNGDQRIERQLPWAQFRDGKVERLDNQPL
ncbi:penicillin-binding protein activator [Stutzerimonas frequens]|uniref:penicillin-binding protein activator n=1 Tax=Stutzerimonas frequens TaxID=2968969 RepID=UPI00106065FF|nr:penicillin-binding protein activator [Stutzerimonas frequens]MDA0423991.1 penicillin-binding protein activator [Stutzerimonas frequens]QTF57860.1 penicillin-binding protein activator [Stutzerimonas frequens]TDL96256.1 penicillin-binding protein activator [Stutzerimonas stutzeri ATCC 17588 = LMG 11199]